jgi:hypothetical protein
MAPERRVRKASQGSEIVASTASTTNSAPAFVFSRTFDASREDVWNALTQPEHLKHWWGTPGSSIEIARHELKPGGMFHYLRRQLQDIGGLPCAAKLTYGIQEQKNYSPAKEKTYASSKQTDEVQNGGQRHAEGKSLLRGQTWPEGRV